MRMADDRLGWRTKSHHIEIEVRHEEAKDWVIYT
jgi:hypothetical protein